MFLFLFIIVSIITLLIFKRFNSNNQSNIYINVLTGICFTFSWATLVVWFTSLIERWQLALNTPAAHDVSIPIWSRTVLELLREAVYLFPVRRLELGILYALPFLLVPMLLVVIRGLQTRQVVILATLVNLLFFLIQLIFDSGLSSGFTNISVQGLILLVTYFLAFFALVKFEFS